MVTLTINIPDEQLPRIVNALCLAGSMDQYHIELPNVPEITAPYARSQLIQLVKFLVVEYEKRHPYEIVEPDVT